MGEGDRTLAAGSIALLVAALIAASAPLTLQESKGLALDYILWGGSSGDVFNYWTGVSGNMTIAKDLGFTAVAVHAGSWTATGTLSQSADYNLLNNIVEEAHSRDLDVYVSVYGASWGTYPDVSDPAVITNMISVLNGLALMGFDGVCDDIEVSDDGVIAAADLADYYGQAVTAMHNVSLKFAPYLLINGVHNQAFLAALYPLLNNLAIDFSLAAWSYSGLNYFTDGSAQTAYNTFTSDYSKPFLIHTSESGLAEKIAFFQSQELPSNFEGVSYWDYYELYTDETQMNGWQQLHALEPAEDPEEPPVEPPPATYTLTVNTATGGYTYPQGTVELPLGNTSVYAYPDSGYSFVNWIYDGAPYVSDNPVQIYMDADHTLTPVFHATPGSTQHRLVMMMANGGTTTPAAGSSVHDDGDTVALFAVALPGWTFSYWSVNDANVSTSTSYTLTMDADKTVRAYFESDEADELPVEAPAPQRPTIPASRFGSLFRDVQKQLEETPAPSFDNTVSILEGVTPTSFEQIKKALEKVKL